MKPRVDEAIEMVNDKIENHWDDSWNDHWDDYHNDHWDDWARE